MTVIIDKFDGEYRFLSNFYPSVVHFQGRQFPTVEHAYQAAKSFLPEDWDKVLAAATPGAAKRLGRRLTLRGDWDQMKLGFMFRFVQEKFSDDKLCALLLGTGDAVLVEGNTWNDTFWGVCNSKGENWLGRVLMIVRSIYATKSRSA